MTRNKLYLCDNCGYELLKWQGQCPSCQSWNTISQINLSREKSLKKRRKLIQPISLRRIKISDKDRLRTGVSEFDRVLGGGLVSGSLILLAGQPGIGKSTLLLQACSKINSRVLFFSGEESNNQIKLRAKRLGIDSTKIDLLADQRIDSLIAAAQGSYQLVIVDSIQTVYDSKLATGQGSLSQIKACGYQLQKIAKERQIPIIVTGHITKEGQIAGPKVLEHLVDTVLYLEGDQNHDQRIVRAIKNRFGSTNETGIFRMSAKGMEPVDNPSELFLSEKISASGSTVGSIIEGQRPLLIEIQALAEKTIFGYPKRRAQGITINRLEVLSAVISNRTKLNLSDKDIYVNIVGGLDVKEPAVDLPICLSIASSIINKPVKPELACFGEVGLAGEVRSVPYFQNRLKEISRLGFKTAIAPKIRGKRFRSQRLKIYQVSTLKEAIKLAI